MNTLAAITLPFCNLPSRPSFCKSRNLHSWEERPRDEPGQEAELLGLLMKPWIAIVQRKEKQFWIMLSFGNVLVLSQQLRQTMPVRG